MKFTILLFACCLFIISCQKEEGDDSKDETEQLDFTGFINIDAKLLIGNPSFAEVGASSEYDNTKNAEGAYNFKNVSIVNQNGNVLNLEQSKFFTFYKEIDFSSNSEFSKTDEFKLLIEFENGDLLESEFEKSDNKVVIASPVMMDAILGNELGFGMDISVEHVDQARLKWDVKSGYKVSNFDSVQQTDDCDTQLDICAKVKGDSFPYNFAKSDCDGDGISNAVECDYGTDPGMANEGLDELKGISYNCYRTEFGESDLPFFVQFREDALSAYQILHAREVDEVFAEEYVVSANVQSISERYYDYLFSLYGDAGIKIPLGPNPAQGNLTNLSNKRQQVIGFFHVSDYTNLSFSTNSDPEGKGIPICLDEDGENFDSNTCADCVTSTRGEFVSFFKPSFWPK